MSSHMMVTLLVGLHTLGSQGSEGSANVAKALGSGVHEAAEIYSVHAQERAYSLCQAACVGKPQFTDL